MVSGFKLREEKIGRVRSGETRVVRSYRVHGLFVRVCSGVRSDLCSEWERIIYMGVYFRENNYRTTSSYPNNNFYIQVDS